MSINSKLKFSIAISFARRRSVECLPNESSLSEDAEIAISSNRCTPATVEINSPSHNVV
jgi:hypothetical protein